jgi:protein subunit release factor A
MELDYREIRLDTYTNGTASRFIRLTHLPTGIVVSGEGRSQYKLRMRLMEELRIKVHAHLTEGK